MSNLSDPRGHDSFVMIHLCPNHPWVLFSFNEHMRSLLHKISQTCRVAVKMLSVQFRHSFVQCKMIMCGVAVVRGVVVRRDVI